MFLSIYYQITETFKFSLSIYSLWNLISLPPIILLKRILTPIQILDYTLSAHPQTAITWKLTGNFLGEQYPDKARGPINEGGLFSNRQGFHLPYPPNRLWASGHPEKGLAKAGIAFYQTSFKLDLPKNYDIPLRFSFGNATVDGVAADYRVLLWVNGYQFGK